MRLRIDWCFTPSCWADGSVAKSEFLPELHGQFSVPRPQVVQLAKRAAGRPVEMSRRIVRGYDNEVYRIGLSGGPLSMCVSGAKERAVSTKRRGR